MRGIYTSVNDIRKRVFAEIARLSYDYKDGDLSQMEQIPYRVIPGKVSTYRESVFLERAIVKERMRRAVQAYENSPPRPPPRGPPCKELGTRTRRRPGKTGSVALRWGSRRTL